jgi:hypothetical protein
MEIIHSDLPPAPITPPMPGSSYRDKAHGFMLATSPLAAATGFVAALVAIIGWQVPIASLATLLIALGGFSFVWLAALIAYQIISAEGALVLHTIFLFGLLRREQKERIKRYGSKK